MEQAASSTPHTRFDEGLFTHDMTIQNKNISTDGEKSSLAFRTISEVSQEIDVPQHVLRFWESRFTQIKPLKRGGGRRYYRPEDIELLRRIKNYLYNQGYTIKGVQRLLKESRSMSQPQTAAPAAKSFAPYANPLSGPMSGMPSYQMPSVKMGSFLQAAAAAPSAMAMAYGVVSGTLQREGQQLKEFTQKAERFADAFEGATLHLPETVMPAADQLTRSLDTVTEIRDELVQPVEPIRVHVNNAVLEAPTEEPVPQETAPAETVVPENSVQAVVVNEMAAPAQPIVHEFTPPPAALVQELQATHDEIFAGPVQQTADPLQMAELKALLADLVSLRDMMNAGVEA